MPPPEQVTPPLDDDDGDREQHPATIHQDDGGEDDDEDDEPRLKYTRLTRSLGPVYRNGDAVSATLVFGERMVIGTHNGNIHILSLPSLSSIRTYHAHSASVSSICVSPPPPPPSVIPSRRQKDVLNDRNISIATSSIDGLVCIVPLIPSGQPQPGQTLSNMPYAKTEIILKNFKRPILAVALSPNFQTDRLFLSGGKSGNLILSTASSGGGSSNWMTLGLGSGKDTILHSGEGAISAIAWSAESPRFVAWVNEQGIKIMRTHIIPPTLQKQGADEVAGNPGIAGWIPGLGTGGQPASEVAWKRISAIERPESISEELASVHKPRLQWVDRRNLLLDEPEGVNNAAAKPVPDWGEREKLLVGWSGNIWVIDVFAGGGGENKIGWAEIVYILQTDCTISGLHMYTPSLLLVLAYLTDNEALSAKTPVESSESGSMRRRGRMNALTPELRLVNLNTSEEVSADDLVMSRFESLASGDYHLGVLPPTLPIARPASGGAEIPGLSGGLWAASVNATQIFSVASMASAAKGARSLASGRDSDSGSSGVPGKHKINGDEIGWREEEKGTKIYITSPYDLVFATERSPADHLHWMLEREQYQEAWDLVDNHPEVVAEDTAPSMYDEEERQVVDKDEDETDSLASTSKQRSIKRYSAVEKEKRRIGELWIQKLIKANQWKAAGKACGKVLGTSTRWEHWVFVFEAAGKVPEITPYIPAVKLSPPLPSFIYDIVLAYYLNADKRVFKNLLLERWEPKGSHCLYDARTIIDAILRKLNNHEDKIEDGDEDWRLLQQCLAKLYMVVEEPRNALRRYILLQDADEAFRLIREYRLIDSIVDDVPALVTLRVSKYQLESAGIAELEHATTEAITLLVDEADRGIVSPSKVVEQLEDDSVVAGKVFLFFYLRRLWNRNRSQNTALAATEDVGTALEDFSDLMVELFAEYDRPLLMEFLRESHSYSFEKASAVCESRNYIPELVHLLSKTGQTKRALFLIIDKLADVSQAINFAKAQDDPDLWNDLLDYSMDKPPFIRGLLENVGTAIDPITLVRRIPTGLEIEGLKEALGKILKEYGVQWSISDGVAKALRSEVARGMENLRGGQRRGVKFQVGGPPTPTVPGAFIEVTSSPERRRKATAGEAHHDACGACDSPFLGYERETLIAFACGHVFHLRCLSSDDKADEEGEEAPTSRPLSDWGNDEESVSYGRSVSAKVTHAALIREKLKQGCKICLERKAGEVVT